MNWEIGMDIYTLLMDGDLGLVTKLCPTLETPWIVAGQAPLSMELSRQEYWSGLPILPSEDLFDPGIKTASPISLLWKADSLPLVLPGNPFWVRNILSVTITDLI